MDSTIILYDDQVISAMVGALMPIVVDFVRVRLSVWNSKAAFWVTMASSLVAGLLISIASNDIALDLKSLLMNLTVIFTASQVVYKQYWETSDSREKLLSKAK